MCVTHSIKSQSIFIIYSFSKYFQIEIPKFFPVNEVRDSEAMKDHAQLKKSCILYSGTEQLMMCLFEMSMEIRYIQDLMDS